MRCNKASNEHHFTPISSVIRRNEQESSKCLHLVLNVNANVWTGMRYACVCVCEWVDFYWIYRTCKLYLRARTALANFALQKDEWMNPDLQSKTQQIHWLEWWLMIVDSQSSVFVKYANITILWNASVMNESLRTGNRPNSISIFKITFKFLYAFLINS